MLFLLFLLFGIMVSDPTAAIPVEWAWAAGVEGAVGLFFLAALSSALGAVLALVPLWLGVAALAFAGRWNIGVRHPAFWAMAGAGMPALALPVFGVDAASPPALALLFTGATCAALARRYVRWPEYEA